MNWYWIKKYHFGTPKATEVLKSCWKKNFLDFLFMFFSMFYDILRRFGQKKFLCLLICILLARSLARSVVRITHQRDHVETSMRCQNLRNFIRKSWLDFEPDRTTLTPPTERKCARKSGFSYKLLLQSVKWVLKLL